MNILNSITSAVHLTISANVKYVADDNFVFSAMTEHLQNSASASVQNSQLPFD